MTTQGTMLVERVESRPGAPDRDGGAGPYAALDEIEALHLDPPLIMFLLGVTNEYGG